MITNYTSYIRKFSILVVIFLTTLSAFAQMNYNTAATLSKNSTVIESSNTILMMDQGVGSLENGIAEIKLNQAIAELIDGDRIEDMVTLSIQLEGESNGVYVTKKSENSFIITELLEGRSNVKFSYEIIIKDI